MNEMRTRLTWLFNNKYAQLGLVVGLLFGAS